MNKKNAVIYTVPVLVLLFFAFQLLHTEDIRQPEDSAAVEPAAIVATGSVDFQQNLDLPVAPPEKAEPVIPVIIEKPVNNASTSIKKSEPVILLDMVFTTQAPFAEWSDSRQQDGCEEASALMAVRWAQGIGELTKTEAKKEILAIAAFEEKNYQNYVDTSAADTLKIIINEYFDYQNASLKTDSKVDEIKQELAKGNALILPMDGKKLKNPNFKNGGPERHNLVIRGYDPNTKEFITNDPGTRKGEGYRYPEKIIEAAWRDYPTGRHAPISGIARNMIIIKKTAIDKKMKIR